MSFLSLLFKRRETKTAELARPTNEAVASPSVEPSSMKGTSPALPLRIVPEQPSRAPRPMATPPPKPQLDGALALDSARDTDESRPKRRRRRRSKPRLNGAEAETPREPLLFPLPSQPGLFSDMPEIERAVAEAGWREPTPIQQRSLPVLRSGVDLVGQAQTGSGKTGAFGLPMLEMVDPDGGVQGLVVVPTRELAEQVTVEMTRLGKHRRIHPVSVYGGVGIDQQIQAIRRGAQIVVGTPGRILDHLERRTLNLSQTRMVVLDEADRMLDMGFQPDVERILRQTPASRQTALFSATIPPDIHELIFRYLRDPEWIRIEATLATVDTVEQVYYEVADQDKFDGLRELLDMNKWPAVLIFRRTQRGVERLTGLLERRRYSVVAIHGGMSQFERQRALATFASGKVRILVATNVAARGLDIPDISHVINYDMPEDFDTYVHRVGRTARIGKRGTAVTFVGESDLEMFDQLRSRLKDQLRPERLAIYG